MTVIGKMLLRRPTAKRTARKNGRTDTELRSVLVLNQFALPRSAAGGTRHVELFERLSNWDATILAADKAMLDQSPVASEGSLKTVPVTRFKGNGVSRIINWISYMGSAGIKGVARRPVDVVYGSSPHMGAALVGWGISRIHRARFVLEIRDLWPQILADSGMLSPESALYRLLKALERFLYRRADDIVVLADGSIDVIAAEGIDVGKIHFIPNGADPESFDVKTHRHLLREELGLSGTVVVYAGAHGPANGLGLILDAAAELRDSDVTFLLVGDGVSKPDLVAEAKQRRLYKVDFRDPIAKSEIPRVFAAADIGLHCLADVDLFSHGVSPNKLYDYMAAGLPVITNTPGEVAAMVAEAEAGEAVGPNEIAVAVKRLCALEEEVRKKLGDNGRHWMSSHRSRAAMAERLERVLDKR